MLKSIVKMIDKVEYALEHHPATRDNDSILIGHIFNSFVEIKRVSGYHVLDLMAKGVLPSTESITRARRKCQELHPHLRGKHYKARKKEANKVKQNINKI